ncbi:hypothetical protein [Solibacillus sp. FSL H8-0538]
MQLKHVFWMLGLFVVLGACNNEQSVEQLAKKITVQEAIDFSQVQPNSL